MSRKSTLLALTLGFAAIGSSFTPATAGLPGAVASIHPSRQVLLPPQVVVGKTGPGSLKPGNGKLKEPLPSSQTGQGGSPKPGNGKLKEPLPSSQTGQIGGGYGKGGIDNICPYNKFKCPPAGQGGSAGGPQPTPSGSGSGPTPSPMPGPQGSGVKFPMPSGQIYPSGGPVVVLAPPVAVQAPPVAVRVPGTVTTGIMTAVTRPAPAAAEPCNCLTKQYLNDGSVLFSDICTKEVAIATRADLNAQVQGAAPAVQ